MSKKFTVADAEPRIGSSWKMSSSWPDSRSTYTVTARAKPLHPDFENPDLMVRFTGPDVDLLLGNKAELLLALEQLTMEALGMAPRRTFADVFRRQRSSHAAHSKNCA